MAIVGSIKVGDTISHYGVWSMVIEVGPAEEGRGLIRLSVQEDGAIGSRTESPKTNIPTLGE